MKNKTIALLLAVVMIFAVMPLASVFAAGGSVDLVISSNYMKKDAVGEARIYVSGTTFSTAGACLVFDPSVVQILNKNDKATAASNAALATALSNAYNEEAQTGAFVKVGQASKLNSNSLSMLARVATADEVTTSTLVNDGKVTADSDGILMFTVYFKMLKDAEPGIKFGTISGDADFGSDGALIDGAKASGTVSYVKDEKPADEPTEDEIAAAAAKAVDDKIAALGDITLEKKAAVAAARTAYDALTAAAKGKVTKLAVLEAAEAKIAELETPVDPPVTDDAAKAFEALVGKISDKLSVADIAAIEAAQTAAAKLTDADKEKISEAVKTKYNNAVKALKTLQAAKPVVDQIDAIGDVTLAKESAVTAARTAYKALSSAAKAYVSNYDKLTAAEAKIKELKAAAEADEAAKIKNVEAAIDALGKTATFENQEAIASAKKLYDSLTDAQKAKVNKTKVKKLESLVSSSAALDKLVADYVLEVAVTDETGLFTVDTTNAKAAMFTSADKALVAEGGTVKYAINIKAAAATDALTAAAKGLTPVGVYSFEIVRIANGEQTAVSTIAAALPVKYKVDAKYNLVSASQTRVFSAFLDNGTASALKDSDNDTYTITTSLASSGSIIVAYKDIENPKTGDAFAVYAFAMMAVLTFAVVAVISRKKMAE